MATDNNGFSCEIQSHSDNPYVTNIINSIIGVGILAIASTFKDTGIFLTLCLLVFGGLLTVFSCSILLRAANDSRKDSYEYLAEAKLGTIGKTVIEICLVGFMLGVMVGYYIALGDLLPPSIFRQPDISKEQRAGLLLFIGVFIIQPLVLIKDISQLTTASKVSLGGYAVTASVILAYGFITAAVFTNWTNEDIIYFKIDDLLPTMSLYALAFACHPQLFLVYGSLRLEDHHKEGVSTVIRTKTMERIVFKALSCVALLYTTLGIFGYLSFETATSGNLLKNYPSHWQLTEIMRLSFCMSCIISFPLLIYPVRQSMYTMVSSAMNYCYKQLNVCESAKYSPLNSLDDEDIELNNLIRDQGETKSSSIHIPPKWFYSLSGFINLLTLTVAILVPDIAIILKLNGSTMGSTMAFILPALIGLRSKVDANKTVDDGGLMPFHVKFSKFLLVIGLALFIISPIVILMED